MNGIDRRSFLGASAAALLVQSKAYALLAADGPSVSADDAKISVRGERYSFEYVKKTDVFSVLDSSGRKIASALLQPIVVVGERGDAKRTAVAGRLKSASVAGSTVKFVYEDVNKGGGLELEVRFDQQGFWFETPEYTHPSANEIVSLHYFADAKGGTVHASMQSTYVTLPGIAEATSVSPIQLQGGNLEQTLSLGHSGSYVAPYTHQQWGLPVHYFCVTSTTTQTIDGGRRDTFTKYRSDCLVCGLADMPNGDLMFDLRTGNRSSLWIDYRSDLWGHMHSPGSVRLGCRLAFAIGVDQRSAASAYGQQLLQAGVIQRKRNSDRKNAVALAPEFCTWGAQVERNAGKARLDEAFLEGLYAEQKASGMKAGIFSIDDKWEGRYGNLVHDATRFPHFVEFLDRIRAEGHQVGLWTAFLRCENPADLGLEAKHMLQRVDGKTYQAGRREYFLLDFTQPEVAKVLAERARNFMRVYKPAVVKFDFGYELPLIQTAAPADKQYCGERLLKRALDIVLGALREVNPDVVVMYYQLSPLFVEYFDLHSTDDLYLAAGDYDLEANRRIYFASVLSELGIPTYGSSGYDWSSSPGIWFDSVASGTIGSLNDFSGDEFGEKATPDVIALYNGCAKAVRQENLFEVIAYPPARPEASMRGARSRSWARVTAGKVTVLAQRPASFDDGDALDHRATDPRVAALLSTTVPVIIASTDADAVTSTRRLVVVPCGEGVAKLKRTRGTQAKVTTHLFGAAAATVATVPIREQMLSLTLATHSPQGVPVEYLEIEIT